MDEFRMPEFRDEHGRVMVWDPTSMSYVVDPNGDQLPDPDRGHATGGDNDLFDPFQHTEMSGSPETEGIYSKTAQEWAPKGHVKCPNCEEVTDGQACPQCGKDLTPEWNQEQGNEFMGVMPEYDEATEFTSWPLREPKRNRMHTDDSFPSETTARTYAAAVKLASFQITADEWDDLFSGQAPLKTEIGKWLIDKGGNLHIDHGMHALHENIAQRDGLNYPGDVGALGSVYNDGTADTQRVFPGFQFNQQTAQAQIEQAFGPVTLQAPVAQAGAEQKGVSFQPFEVQGGQWVIAPVHAHRPLTGIAWVKERPEGQSYQPNMILVAEHLQPEDFALWSRGVTAIITATGGLTSHAAYLASTEGIPVVVGIGPAYNKIETGNYLKVDPATQTITVMPGASGAMTPDQKQQVWDSYLQYQNQRGGSLKPEYFAHIDEELAWREANTPTLDSCPECHQPMVDQDGESVCHGCGHKQPIIQHQAGALALVPELAAGAEGAAGAAGAGEAAGGSGISGIGGIMQKALGGNPLQTAYYGDKLMGGNDVGGGGGDAGTAGDSQNFDSGAETQGVISKVTEAGVLSILEGIVNVLQKTPEALTDPRNPLSYADDVAALGTAAGQGVAAGGGVPGAPGAGGGYGSTPAGVLSKNIFWDHLAADDDEVGRATKNDGTNSDPDEASNSGIEGEKEHGDSPEQLKDVGGGPDESMTHEKLQGDPALQDKALKAFHMNLPLVIEFANSDEVGADNPILRALDELLEEAFPGYKDGHDPVAAEDEHPVTEIHEEIHPEEKDESEDESGEKPDEGDSKEDSKKESSYWNDLHCDDCDRWMKPNESDGDKCPHCGGTNLRDGDTVSRDEEYEHESREASYVSSDDWFHLSFGAPIMPGTGDPVAPGGAVGAPAAQQPAPGAGTCPMCGQSHLPGTPCPTPAAQQNQVVAPAASGGQVTPPQPQTVVTKWQLADVSAQRLAKPDMFIDDKPVVTPSIFADDEFAFFAAAGEGEHHHEHEVEHKPDHDVHVDGGDTSEASTPWLDESGAPLEEGADYELKSSDYAIPDRVTIDRVLPDKIVYTLHSGDVDFQNEMTKDELNTQGFSFSPTNPDFADVDSMDGFDPAENPVRPGQDPTPQQDDLSTPSTVVSHEDFTPISLDTYTGSYRGDSPDDRSWILGGNDSGGVDVDPTLMAKLAGKSYSPKEQRDFINESGAARNLDRLDLEGTHYVLDIDTADTLW